ncbi:MAG TPA: thioesterase family protein [Acidobacteriota bacterium]|nr:thioesterase family protein [Acidobacteriota bacterium]
MHELTIQRKVEFSDTDMAGIVHFSRLIVFMENAEHAFIEALGASVHMDHDGIRLGWPRVAVEAQFKSPARFNDVVDIHLRVLSKKSKAITYGFSIRVGERLVGTGSMTSVCCAMEESGPRAIEIPAFIADQIQEAGSIE